MPEGINDGIHKTTIESRELPLIDLGEFLKSDGSSLGELPEQIRNVSDIFRKAVTFFLHRKCGDEDS